MSTHDRSMHGGTIMALVALLAIPLLMLGLLTFSTASAEQDIAQKHADVTTERYELETCGQVFVAGVDDTLARVRGTGASSQESLAAVEHDLQKISASAAEAAGGDASVSVDATPAGTGVSALLSAPGGAELTIELSVTEGGGYTVDGWTTSTRRDPAPGDTLWTEGS